MATTARKIDSTVTLNNGVRMPIFGLGVYQSRPGEETRRAVLDALAAGYRHVDTAAIYGNERDVGAAVAASGLRREEVFVTTKLWNSEQGYDRALRAFDKSLAKLRMDYVDLFLLHWPVERLRLESWRALEKILADQRAKAIGVSNFTVRHLQQLLDVSPSVPAVNQVEFHPFLFQRELLEYCRAHRIQLEAYSPLTKGQRFGDPTVLAISRKYRKTPAQVLVRWCLEHEVVVIPKSVRQERIVENSQVFDFSLAPEDLAALDALNQDWRTSWDPTGVP